MSYVDYNATQPQAKLVGTRSTASLECFPEKWDAVERVPTNF